MDGVHVLGMYVCVLCMSLSKIEIIFGVTECILHIYKYKYKYRIAISVENADYHRQPQKSFVIPIEILLVMVRS